LRTTTTEPPDYLTVEEAARVLRIGRTAAYALARRWRDTDGREGLPVIRFGRLLRVPKLALEQLTGGLVTAMPAVVKEVPPPLDAPIAEPPQPRPPLTTSPRNQRAHSTAGDQPSPPLT
jgi:excisionase family DNA binding protein